MTSFHQVRNYARQLQRLNQTLYTIRQCSTELKHKVIPSQNIFGLLNQIQETLENADMAKLPLEDVLDDLIACSFNRQGNMNAARAKEVQVIGARLVERTGNCIADKNFKTAYHILRAITRRYSPVYPLILNVTNGLGVLDESLGMLERIGESCTDTILRRQVFQESREMFTNAQTMRSYASGEWLIILAKFVDDSEQEKIFLDHCDSFQSPFNERDDLYSLIGNEVLQAKLCMYERRSSPLALQEFIEANLDDNAMRQYAIEKAIGEGAYARAMQWCHEVISRAAAPDGRGNYTWYVLLLQAAKGCGDQQELITAARWLFQDTKDFDYYLLLKANSNAVLWPSLYPDYIRPLMFSSYSSTLLKIFIEEKDWTNLEVVLSHVDGHDWMKYESVLFDLNPDLLRNKYELMVWHHLRYHDRVKAEQQIVVFLHRMKERFGDTSVANTVALVKALHPRRKRLHEGLEGLFEQ